MTCVVDCSIIIRLLANKPGDELLRQRLARTVHAPTLIDAEISSVVRGLPITSKPEVQMRYNLTAYDAMYIALAESLGIPLLTDDGKLATAPGHTADVHQYPN